MASGTVPTPCLKRNPRVRRSSLGFDKETVMYLPHTSSVRPDPTTYEPEESEGTPTVVGLG